MTGKNIGYIRVSSTLQNHQRQLENIVLDKRFVDQASGKDTNRPQLKAMLDYVRDGDTVIVHSMDRLARNLDDLRKLVTQLTNQQIRVKFLKEDLTFTGGDSPMSTLLLSVMGAFAEFERSLIKERQMEGIVLAKKQNLYKGRKKTLNAEQQATLIQAAKNGVSKTEIAKAFGINRSTVYAYIKQHLKSQTS
jgi:DNA invertase Pin-like site-specific DNA recombinase